MNSDKMEQLYRVFFLKRLTKRANRYIISNGISKTPQISPVSLLCLGI